MILGARDGEMGIGGGVAQELGQVLRLPHLGSGKIFDPLNEHDVMQLREMSMSLHQDPNAANDAQRFIDAHINNKLNIKDLTGGLDEAVERRHQRFMNRGQLGQIVKRSNAHMDLKKGRKHL